MSVQDEIGPVGALRKLPAWRVLQLSEQVKGLAAAAVHHARTGDHDGMFAARKALEKMQSLLNEGDGE